MAKYWYTKLTHHVYLESVPQQAIGTYVRSVPTSVHVNASGIRVPRSMPPPAYIPANPAYPTVTPSLPSSAPQAAYMLPSGQGYTASHPYYHADRAAAAHRSLQQSGGQYITIKFVLVRKVPERASVKKIHVSSNLLP